ncbi:MAG: peptidylprolyl isomerase, partial [Candidatus Dadabacteria bacterium]|nr:peptidylprolyl isomerase [Candidatus Dadabacteria bacterium]
MGRFLIIGLFIGTVITTAYAEREPIDKIVAIVNDDVILASEVGEEVSVRLYQYGPDAVNAMGIPAFTSQILGEMVENRLLLQKADELDIVVSREDVDPLVEDNIEAVRSQYPDEEAFEAALAEYGTTEKKLRKQYRKNIQDQLTIKNLVDIEIMPRIAVDEEEAREYYENNKAGFDLPTLVGISEIVVAITVSPESERQARARIEEIRAKALSGVDFTLLVKQYSKGGHAASGGNFNFSPGETYPELEEAAASLTPGKISGPISLPEGYWLLKLLSADNGNYKTQVILIPVEVTETDLAAAGNKINAAYSELNAGIPFADVAAKYNEDPGTVESGGYLGQFDINGLARDFPKIASALQTLQPGEYSPIIERPEGYYIVKLEERTEGEARDYDSARDDVIEQLR